MNSQELIDKYTEIVDKQKEERLQKINALSAKVDSVMAENLITWFGDLINEFEFGDTTVDGSYSQGYLKINRAIAWNGVPGQISIYVDKSGYDARKNNTDLVFRLPQKHFFGKTQSADSLKEEIDLPYEIEYEHFEGWRFTKASGPIDPIEMGKAFKNMKAALAERAEKEIFSKAEQRGSRCEDFVAEWNFENKSEYWREQFDVEKHFEDCKSEFPELLTKWELLREKYLADENAHKAVIAEKARLELEKRAQYESEEAHLENEAASRFEPIILYRVFHGAKAVTEDDEPDFYTDSILVLGDEPDKDGYFYRIDRGQINRVKCPRIIRIEELIFNSEHEVPDSYPDYPFTKSFIKSEIFDDLKRWYFVIPPEVTRLAEVE